VKMSVTVNGLKETQEYLKGIGDKFTGRGMWLGMKEATMKVTRDAKQLAPVDTGRLRASITPSVRGTKVVEGIVGSNVKYAPYMELGTKRFWPPISALEPWARRHGIPAFLVARSIARYGIAARPFLSKAFEQNAQWIRRRFEEVVRKAIRK
jgi:HK97 gp10 family phage protein